jgi:uncharacterized GH25 family protein
MKQKTRPLCAWIAAFGLCSVAQAHQVWLEQPEGKNAILRFGEFGENLREASPGLLDHFGAPTATLWTKGKAKALTLSKTATGFSAPVWLAPGESLTAEDRRFPIRVSMREGRPGDGAAPPQGGRPGSGAGPQQAGGREGRPGDGAASQQGGRSGGGAGPQQAGGREGRAGDGAPSQREGRSWSWPAARFITDFSAQVPKLTLDIVPTGKPGVFKVTFKEKPLPKAAVEISVQSGWSRKARTDDEGQVRFDLPWQGQYVLSASYTERAPGERDGEKYDAINYATTLTLIQPAGVAPFPAPPAAKANPGK